MTAEPDYLKALEAVANELVWLEHPPFFFGASILPLYLDGHHAEVRPTEDVDVILLARGRLNERQSLEEALSAHGWTHDLRPLRRNAHAYFSASQVPVDVVLDTGEETEDWPIRASRDPDVRTLHSGAQLRIPTPAYYLACKIAASRNPARWGGAYDSKDIEDIAELICGCTTLGVSCARAPEDLRAYLRSWAIDLHSGNSNYGKVAAEVLRANRPRHAPPSAIDGFVASLTATAP